MTAGAIFNLVGQPQGRIATHSQYPIEPRARRMAEALASHGYDVDLFCLRHTGEAAQETLNGVTIHRLPVTRHQGKGSLAYIWEYLRFFLAAGWQITLRHLRKHYALIQVHNPPDFLTFGTLIPRMFGRTRVVLDVRDMAPELFQSRFDLSPDHLVTRTLRAHERWASAYADAVTVCTEHQPGVMARRGIPPDHMTIGMNCPDEVIFDQPAPDTKSEGFSLTYHGSILERSGLDVLICAIPQLVREIPDLRVDIYGIGDFLPTAQELAIALGVNGVTHFHGHVPIEAIPGLIRTADIGVVPVRRDVFTDTILATKLMEYAYLGIPAVVARTSTIGEYFDADMVGFFKSGNAEDLAWQVLTLHRDWEKGRRALVARSRRFLEAHNWSHEKQAYRALIDRLVSGPAKNSAQERHV